MKMAMILSIPASDNPELDLSNRQEDKDILACMAAAAAVSSAGATLEALPPGFTPGENDVSTLEAQRRLPLTLS